VVALLQALADEPVVVDLAIDGEGDALIGVGEGLGAAPCMSVRKPPVWNRDTDRETYRRRRC
jgi:hypothetical protein